MQDSASEEIHLKIMLIPIFVAILKYLINFLIRCFLERPTLTINSLIQLFMRICKVMRSGIEPVGNYVVALMPTTCAWCAPIEGHSCSQVRFKRLQFCSRSCCYVQRVPIINIWMNWFRSIAPNFKQATQQRTYLDLTPRTRT